MGLEDCCLLGNSPLLVADRTTGVLRFEIESVEYCFLGSADRLALNSHPEFIMLALSSSRSQRKDLDWQADRKEPIAEPLEHSAISVSPSAAHLSLEV